MEVPFSYKRFEAGSVGFFCMCRDQKQEKGSKRRIDYEIGMHNLESYT
jgi:hypothetical protein